MIDYGYVRESTQKQEESGLGREAQLAAIAKFHKSSDNPYGGTFIDSVVSGMTRMTERPAGAELDKAIRRGDRIIVSRLDRAFRKTVDALDMVERWNSLGVKFVVCDFQGQTIDFTTAMGKFVLTVLVAAAEMERMHISERTKIALAQRKIQGFRVNNEAGIGWKWVKVNDRIRKRIPDLEARELMSAFYEWHEIQGMSIDHVRQHTQFTLKIKNKWGHVKVNPDGRWGRTQIYHWILAEGKRRTMAMAGDLEEGVVIEGIDDEESNSDASIAL